MSLEETVKEKGKWVVANERVIEQGSGLAVVVEVLVRDCGTQHCELAEADEEDGQADHSHDNFASECGENGTLGLHTNTSSANTQTQGNKHTNSRNNVQIQTMVRCWLSHSTC